MTGNFYRATFIIFWVLSLILCMVESSSAEALAPSNVLETYERMQRWELSNTAIPVPSNGLVIQSDCGKWTMKSGVIQILKPLAGDPVTGLLFEGEGMFEMEIPDPIERMQLVRFTDGKLSSRIEESFNQLIVRDSGNRLEQFITGETTIPTLSDKIVKDRHELYLKIGNMDIDSRILMGIMNQDDPFLIVDANTGAFGWLTYVYDRTQREEIQLLHFDAHKDDFDTWISLDRQADRLDSGRPSRRYSSQIDITQVEIAVDLTSYGWESTWGSTTSSIRMDSKMTSHITFVPMIPGLSALEFGLTPAGKVTDVKSADGTDMKYIRNHIGERFKSVKDEYFDDSIIVFFDDPLSEGEKFTLQFDYELELKNFASGRSWYPSGPGGFQDQHTVRFEATMDRKFDIFAVGQKTEETIQNKQKISKWESISPTAMYGFTFGKNFEQETIKLEAMPDIVCFGTESAFTVGNMIRNVGADVANSMKFYMWFLDETLPDKPIYVTCIDAWHGQAFEGLIHLSKYTFSSEHPGKSELFRAHETAHQFWGHAVGFSSYRDQWISEAFAEYFALLFAETTMDDPKYFNDAFKAHAEQALNHTEKMKNISPIDVGYRVETMDLPSGYLIQTYDKGTMVLHMIRVVLRNATKNEDAFRDVVQTFYKTYKGKNSTTADFQKILESKTQSDWSWFFKQWIDNSYYPTYEWSWKVDKINDDNTFPVTVNVVQSGVPDDFKMIVPLMIKYKNGKTTRQMLLIDKPQNTFNFNVKTKPKQLVLNPDWSVLARVEKR